MATKGLVLVAGLVATTACASLETNEPETRTASSELNASPSASAGTALSSGRERSFGASCVAWDTGASLDVVITAFGYKGTAPTYLNTYDVYSSTGNTWTGSGTVQTSGGGTVATAAAYVSAVTDPDINDGNAAHRTTCYFAGGYNGSLQNQVWKATVSNGTVTWTKLANLNTARAKFGLTWAGTTTHKLIAFGGGFGTSRTNSIETYSISGNAWTTETATLDQSVHSFGWSKLSDTKIVTAGGDGSGGLSAHINAIKVNANGTVNSVGDIVDSLGGTVIAARKDNIALPTGKTGLGGTDRAEILVSLGQTNTPTLVTTSRTVVIEWNSSPPAYVSDAAPGAGQSPSTNVAFPTVVDAYVSPFNATSNPGYIILSGINAASPQVAVNTIQKWNPGTGGGSWGTATTFAAQNRVGVSAVYVKSIDKVVASSGTDRYPASASSTDYLNVDLIQ